MAVGWVTRLPVMPQNETIPVFPPRPGRPRFFRLVVRWLTLGTLATALTGIAADKVNLSGAYEDYGVALGEPVGTNPAATSLHALLGLDFAAIQAGVSAEDMVKTSITQTDEGISVETQDSDGKVTWQARWRQGVGCALEADRVVLMLHSPVLGRDQYVLTLRPAQTGGALLVEVQSIRRTLFGPAIRPAQTYLFARY